MRFLVLGLTLLLLLGGSRASGSTFAPSRGAASCPAPAVALPRNAITAARILGPASLGAPVLSGAGLAVPNPRTGAVHLLDASGIPTANLDLPTTDFQRPSLAADDSGNIYALRYPSTLVKYSTAGRVLWTRSSAAALRSVFVLGKGSAQRVGVVLRDAPSASTFTLAGTPAGSVRVVGDSFTRTRSGGLVGIDEGRYVRVFNARGTETLSVGDRHRDNDPNPAAAPLHFYQLGGAVQLPGGRLLVSDTKRGLMLLSADGLLLGEVAPTEIDPLGLTERSGVVVLGDHVYVGTGDPWSSNQYLSRLSVADVLRRAKRGGAKDPRLGIGAGLVLEHRNTYVASGSSAQVKVVFDPWWRRHAKRLSLCWTLRDLNQLRAGAPGTSRTVSLTDLVGRGRGVKLELPKHLRPGAYQVDAVLVRAGAAVSKTALVFTKGTAEMRLNFAALPAGPDWGGPAPARGVALADQLGTGAFRAQLDWGRLLKNGPEASLDLSTYVQSFRDAAAEARRRGVSFVVQVGQGGPEKALVANGAWERRVEEVVSGLKEWVHVWEAWNEPNATYGPPADYVNKVLAPFARAVKRADPTAKVIGGSTVGINVWYWKGIAAAGGLRWLDIAGVHPYTGHNRSWEEDGTISQLRALRELLTKDGAQVPIWNTEHAWWSDGPANLLRQADNSARAVLWMRAFGIEKWAYFIAEGGWGDHNASFSAIQVNSFVKPAALAIMTASNQVAGRPFLGEVDVGFPSAYALRFGPRRGDRKSGELIAAWTDAMRLPIVVSSGTNRPVRLTRALGATQQLAVGVGTQLMLDSDPLYLAVRGPGRLRLRSQESAGKNLALRSAGATVAATSAIATNPPSAATDGINDASTGGDLPGLPMWVSAPRDSQPGLTVSLKGPERVNRVVVSTHSLGNTVPGLRDYDVHVRAASTQAWSRVARVRGQFHHRQKVLTFPARIVTQVKLTVLGVNFGGYNGGERHAGWQTDAASLANPKRHWYGPAVVSEIAVYAPGKLMLPTKRTRRGGAAVRRGSSRG